MMDVEPHLEEHTRRQFCVQVHHSSSSGRLEQVNIVTFALEEEGPVYAGYSMHKY